MRSLTAHLRVLIIFLTVLGLSIIFYQVFYLKTPLVENEVDNLWTIDAQIDFDVKSSKPVEVKFYIPIKSDNYTISDEIFLAKNYGQNVDESHDNNRIVTWSARKTSGKQTLYYRLNLTKRYSDEEEERKKGETWREVIPVSGAQKLATDTLINEIREKSSNTVTFITTTINMVNDTSNDNVNLLLGKNKSLNNKVKIIESLLSQAHIPIEQVHTLRLSNSLNQTPELWIRSYINNNNKKGENSNQKNEKGQWYYFNPLTGGIDLPNDRLIWWVGDTDVVDVDNGSQVKVTFSVEQNELTAISLAKLAQEGRHSFTDYSFYSLPVSTQLAYKIMLVIPFGVVVVLILRNIIGLNTLGTFTPVLIALAYRETGLIFGLIFFSIIVFIGLSLRSYLEHLKLQMLPRLSIVLTFVVLLIVFSGLISHKLSFEQGLSITLFPMVILTMTIERLSVTWEERGGLFAFKVAIGTLITASIAYLVMEIHGLLYFVFTFPAVLLLLIAFMLAMGRYRGYRLLEILRFKALNS